MLIEYVESVDMAYTIDPPEEEQPDEATLACAFDCPFGNGLIVSSLSNTDHTYKSYC